MPLAPDSRTHRLYIRVRAALYAALTYAGKDDKAEVEREFLNGMDHQALGACLAEQWRFPKNCQLVAGYHHQPAALGEQNKMLVMLVHVADTICCQSRHGFNLTALHQTLDEVELRKMQLDPALVQRTASNLDNLVSVASLLLS